MAMPAVPPAAGDVTGALSPGPGAVGTGSSDAELIAAARAGDGSAYGVLYERHRDAARRLAYHLTGRADDAEDAVAETFARVLAAIRRGSGPTEAFRPYLLAALRHVAADQRRGQRGQVPVANEDLPDPGQPFADPALVSLERSLVTRAFRSLPERWSAVLGHTEVEQARPAEVALIFGLTPNAVSALSHRAREGLRQAYLQLHLSSRAKAECGPIAARLGAHVRGAVSRRDARRIDGHLRRCSDCQAAYAELTAINGTLRGLLAPAFLGGAFAAGAGAAGPGGRGRPGRRDPAAPPGPSGSPGRPAILPGGLPAGRPAPACPGGGGPGPASGDRPQQALQRVSRACPLALDLSVGLRDRHVRPGQPPSGPSPELLPRLVGQPRRHPGHRRPAALSLGDLREDPYAARESARDQHRCRPGRQGPPELDQRPGQVS